MPFWSKVLWHGATNCMYGPAYFSADRKMCCSCTLLTLYVLVSQLIIRLGNAKKICGQFSGTSAIEKLMPHLAGRVRFVFLFVELTAPYAVTPLVPSGALRQLGDLRWKRACETWARCLKTNTWPGHVTEITRVEAMPWALTKEMDHDANV